MGADQKQRQRYDRLVQLGYKPAEARRVCGLKKGATKKATDKRARALEVVRKLRASGKYSEAVIVANFGDLLSAAEQKD